MNTKLYKGILLRVMLMFAIPFIGSFVHDIPGFDVNVLGDVWKEYEGNLSYRTGWEWGFRHYLLNWTIGVVMCLQALSAIIFASDNID